MQSGAYVFTIFFLTIGPIKTLPAFAKITHSMPLELKRDIAIRATLIASFICIFVALLGEGMLRKYRISLEAVEIAAGLVLLLSALKAVFPTVQPSNPPPSQPTAMQLAISPVASPIIVPPIGIAAILIFIVLAPRYPGMYAAITQSLAIMLALNFLVMFFLDRIIKLPGLMLVLQVFGAALVFFQVALSIEIILVALRTLGVVRLT